MKTQKIQYIEKESGNSLIIVTVLGAGMEFFPYISDRESLDYPEAEDSNDDEEDQDIEKQLGLIYDFSFEGYTETKPQNLKEEIIVPEIIKTLIKLYNGMGESDWDDLEIEKIELNEFLDREHVKSLIKLK
jgi:hypothetical protein